MKISPRLRKTESGHAHWCPGCQEMHVIPDTWSFNGDVDKPTFSPSVLIRGMKRMFADGKWNGEWIMENNRPVPFVCHYFLINGILNFCGDCTYSLSGKTVPMIELHED